MTNAKKAEKVFQIQCQRDETEEQALARTVLSPTLQSASTIQQYSNSPIDLDLAALIDCLDTQVEQVKGGNLNRIEKMLLSQAHTLDAITNNLFRRAIGQEYMRNLESYLKLGLRAQNQCRTTLEALIRARSPKTQLNQTNIAHNQQINNGLEKENPPNELMEDEVHESDEWLDRGAPQETIKTDSDLEAVGEIDRSAVA